LPLFPMARRRGVRRSNCRNARSRSNSIWFSGRRRNSSPASAQSLQQNRARLSPEGVSHRGFPGGAAIPARALLAFLVERFVAGFAEVAPPGHSAGFALGRVHRSRILAAHLAPLFPCRGALLLPGKNFLGIDRKRIRTPVIFLLPHIAAPGGPPALPPRI
jgi:hypothetical protein